jgi:hypothetical protein
MADQRNILTYKQTFQKCNFNYNVLNYCVVIHKCSLYAK